ncbi:MAG: hypothetical protein AAF573_18940, partial [Bacteroidota bacterium]
NRFTPAQAAKVEAGIEIFNQVISSDEFQNRVSNFQWTTPEGTTFNRFFVSNGMSNEQVCDMICNGVGTIWNGGNGEPPLVNIVPCATVQEVEACCTNPTTPCVPININVINNSWYTPVHVACAIVHEWCCCNGFTGTTFGVGIGNWSNNTVPVACAWICKDVCPTVCNTTEVTNWCNMINDQTFDYCPCTTTFQVSPTTTGIVSPINNIDACINTIETELSWLRGSNNVTPSVNDRITVLTNCISTLTEMKTNLCNTSLDGCDVFGVPVTTSTMETVAAN